MSIGTAVPKGMMHHTSANGKTAVQTIGSNDHVQQFRASANNHGGKDSFPDVPGGVHAPSRQAIDPDGPDHSRMMNVAEGFRRSNAQNIPRPRQYVPIAAASCFPHAPIAQYRNSGPPQGVQDQHASANAGPGCEGRVVGTPLEAQQLQRPRYYTAVHDMYQREMDTEKHAGPPNGPSDRTPLATNPDMNESSTAALHHEQQFLFSNYSVVKSQLNKCDARDFEQLKVSCQLLEKKLRTQQSLISDLDRSEQKTIELGAQWNHFHHAQMQKQASLFQSHLEAKEGHWRYIKCELEKQLDILRSENRKLRRSGLLRSTYSAGTVYAGRGTPSGKPNAALQECEPEAKSSPKRKFIDLSGADAKPQGAESVCTDKAGLPPAIYKVTQRSLDKRVPAAVAPDYPQAADESGAEHSCRLGHVDTGRTGLRSAVDNEAIKLVDGILPLPRCAIMDKKHGSRGEHNEPKIAEIKEVPEPPRDEMRVTLPKIVDIVSCQA